MTAPTKFNRDVAVEVTEVDLATGAKSRVAPGTASVDVAEVYAQRQLDMMCNQGLTAAQIARLPEVAPEVDADLWALSLECTSEVVRWMDTLPADVDIDVSAMVSHLRGAGFEDALIGSVRAALHSL